MLLIGCGSVGRVLAENMQKMREIEKFYVYDEFREASQSLQNDFDKAEAVENPVEFMAMANLVIEAASQKAVEMYGPDVLKRGIDFMIMSVGALGSDELRNELFSLAKEKGGRIYIPSGAVCGTEVLDGASVADIEYVELETVKPPEGLRGSRYLKEKGIDPMNVKERTVVFEGSARDAVQAFPKNVNVSATLSLIGIGFDRTRVKVVLDPNVKRNKHHVRIVGDFGISECSVENVPSPDNPRTSYLAAISAVATLRRIVSGIWVGI